MENENTDMILSDLRSKLSQIEHGLLFNLEGPARSLGNALVHCQGMDEDGQIWVALQRTELFQQLNESRFPLHLLLYKKGLSYYIETTGIAHIHHNDLSSGQTEQRLTLLVKPVLIEIVNNRRWFFFPRWLRSFFSSIRTGVMNFIFPRWQAKRSGQFDYYQSESSI